MSLRSFLRGGEPLPPTDATKLETPRKPDEMSLDEVFAEANELFGQLPAEIQDPVSRGRKDPIIWSSTPDRPSVFDLMRLSEEDLAKYTRVVELTQYWLGEQPPATPGQ